MTRAGVEAVLVDLRAKARRLAVARDIIERREDTLDNLFAKAQLDRIKRDEVFVARQIADAEHELERLPTDA